MLEVSRRFVVLGDNGPTILFYPHPIASKVKHGFNRYNHTRFKPGSATRAEVEYERVLMIVEADPVPAIFAHDAVPRFLGNILDRSADIVESGSSTTGFAACVQGPLSVIEKLLETRGDLPDSDGHSRVADEVFVLAVVFSANGGAEIETDYVAVLEHSVFAGYAV